MVTNGDFLGTKSNEKGTDKYYCEKCDYSTSHTGFWKKHLKTKKHNGTRMVTDGDFLVTKSNEKERDGWWCECGKRYAYKQGYYRHKRSCTYQDTANVVMESDDTSCPTIAPTERELVSKMFELVEKMEAKDKIISDLVQRVGNNNNNTNNIIIQLNTNCPDAIPIQDLYAKINALPKCVCHDPKLLSNAIVQIVQQQSAGEKTIRSIQDTMYVKHRDSGFVADDQAEVFDLVKKETERDQLSKAAEQNAGMFIREKEGKEYPEIVSGLTRDLTSAERKQMKTSLIKAIGND